jgi:hypothetical protein
MRKFNSFREFYPFYLEQHQDKVSRRLHFIGLVCALIWMIYVLCSGDAYWRILFSLLMGYGAGFIGHFFFEKNKPATFRYPLYSFAGDFTMMKDIFIGKIPF